MANFYKDNEDIQFLLKHMGLEEVAELAEEGFKFADEFDNAPKNAEEALKNYEMVLNSLGQLSGDFIYPRSEHIDRQGTAHNQDGTVRYADGIADSLDALAKAEVMGFTLPHRFGGLNFPESVYSSAIEIISRGDASLMNIFGLQGIAETINSFASEEIKQKYLHDFSAGKLTGAMVLTEPDAGSDLQACKLKAFQDDDGNWLLHGVKRFITNGCGEVLLVLAKSEQDRSGGLGLSLFVCRPGPTVSVRRIEDKLGIHGSPTCELFFDNTPCRIIGERQRGLVTYVMALMNGARIGIGGQSLGIAEATYRVARDYAASRVQFGVPIEKLPAVRDMVIDMKMEIEASRALLYEASRIVDLEIGLDKKLNSPDADEAEKKGIKKQLRKIKRAAAMLTPMSKYYCSEMCNSVAYDSIQVLGGSGFMRDYPCERLARDARITTIYEGTSQLQCVAAVRGICGGTLEKYLPDISSIEFDEGLKELLDILAEVTEKLREAVVFVKDSGIDYMDLYARDIVDVGIFLVNGYLLCGQASSKVDMDVAVAPNGDTESQKTIKMVDRKKIVAFRYITKNYPRVLAKVDAICSGEKSTFSAYEALVGPVPEEL